jgi:uncharacterized protein GlcG (DUF336 family)
MKRIALHIALGLVATQATAGSSCLVNQEKSPCNIPNSTVTAIQNTLCTVVTGFPDDNGSIFAPKPGRWWSAIVDRQGQICSIVSSSTDAWPGSRAIAIAKAGTANDFSNNLNAFSTANLYPLIQPGGSLYGLNNSNPFNPAYLAQGSLNSNGYNVAYNGNSSPSGSVGIVPGGIITFGGGVALYKSGQVIGGLGVSGDTSCADHAVAWRMRKAAGYNGTPNDDNISYGPSGQPHCLGAADVIPQ